MDDEPVGRSMDTIAFPVFSLLLVLRRSWWRFNKFGGILDANSCLDVIPPPVARAIIMQVDLPLTGDLPCGRESSHAPSELRLGDGQPFDVAVKVSGGEPGVWMSCKQLPYGRGDLWGHVSLHDQ